ncbi:MAG: class I SAM-dependent methyltransferase, partial [Armatimonadetes bacterium]
MDRPELNPEILDYYEAAWDESVRIRSGINELELVRTRELVERYLPAGTLRILDVGGAAGVHSGWLLDAGHRVDLIDPVPRHVDQAVDALGSRPGFNATEGDGRHLEFDDEVFDAVLLFGPLYHLQDNRDRLACWSEAKRVVKPGGWVFGAVISRFSSLFSGLSEDAIFDPVFRAIVEQELDTGR